MSRFSRVYDWGDAFIDLSRIVTISSVMKDSISGKYQYKLTLDCGKDWTWTSTHTEERNAETSRREVISAWKRYCDKTDEEAVQKTQVVEHPQEDIPVDPIESLEPK